MIARKGEITRKARKGGITKNDVTSKIARDSRKG